MLLILCPPPPNCEFDLKCYLYISEKRHGIIIIIIILFALGELFIVVQYFVEDVTRQNTLPQIKDVQLPHYCISKYVALGDILAVTSACPLIFS